MPNHWHFVVWPRNDGELSTWAQWLTVTHVRRWHANHHSAGTGPVYQGRFKSFPVQEDDHLLSVCRYVERNAFRADLVPAAATWRWGSLWHREHGTKHLLLDDWPIVRPADWTTHVEEPQTELELAGLRRCVKRGSPFGMEDWRYETAKKLGLLTTLRPRGRPRLTEPGKE